MVRENMRSPHAVPQFSFLRVGILQGGLVVRVRDLSCGGAVYFRVGRRALVARAGFDWKLPVSEEF